MGLKIKGFAEIKRFGKGVMPSTCIFFSCHRANSRSKLCYFQFKHQQTPPVRPVRPAFFLLPRLWSYTPPEVLSLHSIKTFLFLLAIANKMHLAPEKRPILDPAFHYEMLTCCLATVTIWNLFLDGPPLHDHHTKVRSGSCFSLQDANMLLGYE